MRILRTFSRPVARGGLALPLALGHTARAVHGFRRLRQRQPHEYSARLLGERQAGTTTRRCRRSTTRNWEGRQPDDERGAPQIRLQPLRPASPSFAWPTPTISRRNSRRATAGYKAFIHDYPNDPEIPYARYQVTLTQYNAVSQSFLLLPALEERDLASVNDAPRQHSRLPDRLPEQRPRRGARLHASGRDPGYWLATSCTWLASIWTAANFKAAIRAAFSTACAPSRIPGSSRKGMVLLAEVYMKQKERQKGA